MRNKILFTTMLIALGASITYAQEGFGTNTPSPSSVIDAVANDKGVLLPRVLLTSTTVAAPVTAPANGLTVFNTNTAGDVTPGYYYWSVALTKWVRMIDTTGATASGWGLTGNMATASGTSTVGNAIDGNFLGTTDAKDLVLATNNTKRMIIDTHGNAVGGTNSALNLIDAGFGMPWGNFVWGNDNTVDNTASSNGYSNTIFGFLNKSTAANSTILGYNNKDLNTVLDEGYNIIAGNDNTVNNTGIGTSSNVVMGSANTVNNGRTTFVIGAQNTINGINTRNSVTLGMGNTLAHINAFAIGNSAATTADNQLMANFSGGYNLMGSNVGVGTATVANSTLQINGSVSTAIRVVTGSTTLDDKDYTIIKTGNTAATITLPAASTCKGRVYHIIGYTVALNNDPPEEGWPGTVWLSEPIYTSDYTSEYTSHDLYLLVSNVIGASSGRNATLTIQSDGINWYSIGR